MITPIVSPAHQISHAAMRPSGSTPASDSEATPRLALTSIPRIAAAERKKMSRFRSKAG